MIRRFNEQITEDKCIRGGNGLTHMRKLLNGADEMYAKGRMFNVMTLAPGNSIGEHTHEGDNEIFYFIRGEGEYTDNGKICKVGPGDAAVCNSGDSHALKNTGTEDLEFIALILYD